MKCAELPGAGWDPETGVLEHVFSRQHTRCAFASEHCACPDMHAVRAGVFWKRGQTTGGDSAPTTPPPPPPREWHPDDGANGASATSATNSGNDSGRSGPVADGTTLVQVHTGMVGTTAAAANGSCEVDHKRKRNDTSGPANAMRAWLLPPPGGHPPGTKTAMEGAMAVRLGLTPPPPSRVARLSWVLGRQWLKPSRPGSRDARLASRPLGREGASKNKNKTRDVEGGGGGGVSGWGGEASCGGERARLARARERDEEWSAGKEPMTHSDPQICHRNPPLFPSPETVQYCCAIQGRLELLDSARGLGSTVA